MTPVDMRRKKEETEALARLATSSDWPVIRDMLGRLADNERRHLAHADFQNLLMVGSAQGRVYAYESLIALVEKAPERASRLPKEE